MAAPQDQTFQPMPKARLLIFTGGALIIAALIVLGAIMPAEFHRDPLSLGKLTGIARLWAPGETKVDPNAGAVGRAHEYDKGFRSDVIEIPLTSFLGGRFGSELEYKVSMKKDATLIYEWQAVGPTRDDDLFYDFHGHTVPKSSTDKMVVSDYKQGVGLHGAGALTAPFDGIQGWLFTNSSEKPVLIRVRLSGFYDLIPSGQPGNEAGVIANVPAAEARPKVDPRAAAEAGR